MTVTAKDRYAFDVETVVGRVGDWSLEERESLGITHLDLDTPATQIYLWTMEREDGKEQYVGFGGFELVQQMIDIARKRRQEKEREQRKRESRGVKVRDHVDKVEFWAHNVKFDSSFIDWIVLRSGGEVGGIVTELGAHILKEYMVVGEQFVLKDTMKITQSSLAKSAPIVGLRKLDAGVDFSTLAWDHKPSDQEIEYCKMDTHIVAMLLRWMRQNDMRGMTVAGCSFSSYLTRFYYDHRRDTRCGEKHGKAQHLETFRKYYPRLDDVREHYCRKAYYGGMVVVNPSWQNMDLEHITVKDRRSSYPASAFKNRYPYGLGRWVEPWYVLADNEVAITQFEITSLHLKDGGVPWLTVRGSPYVKPDEHITDQYLQGERITLTSVDEQLLRENYDCNVKPLYKLVFQTSPNVGKAYLADHFIHKTIAPSKGESTYHKYMLNGWTGQWGMKARTPHMVCTYEYDKGIVRWKHDLTDDGETIFVEREPRYVPVVAFITAYSRQSLINEIRKVGDRFVYCDTDSVHYIDPDFDPEPEITPTDPGELIDDYLGSWAVEGHFDYARYIGPKAYIHADKVDDELIIRYGDHENYVKCAGMPATVKAGWAQGANGEPAEHTVEEFAYGYKTANRLISKTVVGGIALVKSDYEIKDRMSTRLNW